MNKQGMIQRTLLAMAIASAFGFSATALAGDFNNPQGLEVGSGGFVTATGTVSNPSTSMPDVHYYAFQGNAGEVITVDIDGTTGGLDTVLHLFDPAGIMVQRSDSTEPADEGSAPWPTPAPSVDSMIKTFRLSSSGVWKVAVGAKPYVLTHQGVLMISRASSNGGYTMIVSGLTPSFLAVNIDIKPGTVEFAAPINPKSKGVIPVALLSNPEFDPFKVEQASLRFGHAGNEASLRHCQKEGADLNGDGKPDRVCHFDNEKTGFRRSSLTGILTGTVGGRAFEGRGDLKIVPDYDD